ncbi:hypothetical protein [Burkholderia diffusa]|uniref:hypothetical protein n=1 Tax=Burkholderia diffusa TaxID=488732 RepID=UPI00157B5428|nr:hypothetical protein [Burkholderia diffusa]NTY40224.1 hypothetical protein [Burkholderia diffusa]
MPAAHDAHERYAYRRAGHALPDLEERLADVRESTSTRSAAPVAGADVERTFRHPRPADALEPDSVVRQLQNMRARQPDTMNTFDESIAHLVAIDSWRSRHADAFQPDFSASMNQHRRSAGKQQDAMRIDVTWPMCIGPSDPLTGISSRHPRD